MSNSGQEIEAKFYLKDSERMITRLQELEARMIQPRVLETNLQFDFPDASLRSKGQVLRLRRDTKARLTYKGPNQSNGGVLDRTEIEFVVEDYEQARQFLEALGYQKSGYYEKYRTTYELETVEFMLDELPYGNFLEIEGETSEQIQAAASKLNLNWKTAIETSYTALFENVRKELQLSFQDISFENFKGIKVEAHHLHVHAADK
jgi:adenylate cyclase, class 2